MNYFYTLNGQQQGPVTEEQLRQMAAWGSLAADTLVWREGMAEWQPYSTVFAGGEAGVQCTVCKQMFPPDQTIQYDGKTVCANCKPTLIQQLREGVSPDSSGKLYAIAVNQRRLVMTFLVLILCNIARIAGMASVAGGAGVAIAILFGLVGLAAVIACIVFSYRLAKALELSAPLMYAILAPCCSLVVVLVLSSRATKALKKAGVKVGFFGASKETVEQLRRG